MPRSKNPPAVPAVGQLSTEVLAASTQAADQLVALEGAVSAEQIAFSQAIGARMGRRQQASLIAKLVTVTDLIELQQIKDSRAYKGAKVMQPDGKVVTVTTWADFCEVVEGRSVEQVDEDLRNLKTFGASFMECAQRMGLGYRELRDMRSIPADQRTELLEAAERGDKATLIDVAETLIEKHTQEKAALERTVEDLKLQAKAKDQRIQKQADEHDQLVARMERPFTPDEDAKTAEERAMLDTLHTDAVAVELAIRQAGATLQALLAAQISPSARLAGEQCGQWLAQVLGDVLGAAGVAVDVAEAVTPYWMRAALEQTKAATTGKGKKA